MRITCQKSDLLKGINIVLKAVSNKTTNPILECILLETDFDQFKLISNDMELGIESTVTAEIIEQGSVAIEAKIFSEIVKKLPEKKVEITVDNNNIAIIKCENSKYKIAGQSGIEFPQLPEINKDSNIEMSQLVLKDMIRQTIFSISVDESKQILTGELIEIKNKNLNIVAVDRCRVSLRKTHLSIENEDIKVVVPGKTLNEISKILSTEIEENVSLFFTENHILFDLGNSLVVSRLLDGNFLEYEQTFSTDYETKIVIDRKEFLMSIERAALISRESNKNPIKIEIKDNKIIITSNTNLDTAYEEIPIELEGKNLMIAFNPKYLIEVLRNIDDEKVCINYTSSLGPCTIYPIEGNMYKYLVLPIRLNS